MSSHSATAPVTGGESREKTQHTPTLLKLARRIARAYREQMVKENYVLLMGRFAALDQTMGETSQRPDPTDPLERLWRLPASLDVRGIRTAR